MTQASPGADVRAQLLSQAEKPFSELLPPLREAHAAAMRVLEGVSEAQARFKPVQSSTDGEGAWCIAEVLRHLIQSEEGNADRIPRLARGERGESPVAGRLGGHETTPLAGLVAALSAADNRLAEVAQGFNGQEVLDTTATHPLFGELNCRAWIALYTTHLRSHSRQIAEVKAAPGYPAS